MGARSRGSRWREALTGYGLVLPSMVVFAVFYLYPVAHTLYLSFFEWNLTNEPRPVGLDNYAALLSDEVFGEVLWNTLSYSLATVLVTMLGGLVLALLLNRPGRLQGILQACIFTSYIVSWVGVSLLWIWMLDAQYGPVNGVLSGLGLDRVDWLGDPELALWSLVGVTSWKTVGYDMVLFLAGLQSIPTDTLEAASIDGASRWQRFWSVTFPQLMPTTLFVLITSVIMTFQGFDVVRVMTQGGPVRSTTIYVYFVYEQAFGYFKVGYASAAVVLFFVVLLGVTVLQFRLFDRQRREESP